MKAILVAAMSVSMLAATPLAAEPIPEKGLTLEQVASHLKEKGYRAELSKDKDDPHVITGMEGLTVYIELKDCEKAACKSLQVLAAFDLKEGITYQRANEWNHDKRWAMMSLDKDMDPWMSMDISLSPGGTYEALDDALELWQTLLDEAKTFLSW